MLGSRNSRHLKHSQHARTTDIVVASKASIFASQPHALRAAEQGLTNTVRPVTGQEKDCDAHNKPVTV